MNESIGENFPWSVLEVESWVGVQSQYEKRGG